MSEYIKKRWDLPTMEKRIENLKKVIDVDEIERTITFYLNVATDNRLDALYLTYYDLRDKYCKLKRNSFGLPKIVSYEPKCLKWVTTASTTASATCWYDNNYNTASSAYWEPSNYTWTVTTATNIL